MYLFMYPLDISFERLKHILNTIIPLLKVFIAFSSWSCRYGHVLRMLYTHAFPPYIVLRVNAVLGEHRMNITSQRIVLVPQKHSNVIRINFLHIKYDPSNSMSGYVYLYSYVTFPVVVIVVLCYSIQTSIPKIIQHRCHHVLEYNEYLLTNFESEWWVYNSSIFYENNYANA